LCLSSAANATTNDKFVDEEHPLKTPDVTGNRKRESTDGDVDAPSKKKTILGSYTYLVLYE